MTEQACYQHCLAETNCKYFTWFQGRACRRFGTCPEAGRYTTSTQPAKTFQVNDRVTPAPDYTMILDGKSCPDPMLDQRWEAMTEQACYQHCLAETNCKYFTWFQ